MGCECIGTISEVEIDDCRCPIITILMGHHFGRHRVQALSVRIQIERGVVLDSH